MSKNFDDPFYNDMAKVIDALKEARYTFPEQRIGQIIINCLPDRLKGDAFNISDAELADSLLKYARNRQD